MKMARASSGLQYPERFYAAASYVGFDGFTSPSNFITSKFSNSTALLYNLYQQASIRPCSIPEPSSWKLVERSKWARFEEENPGRYSRASNSAVDPVVDVLMNHNSKVDPIIENGNTYPEIKTISTENGSQVRTQDKDVVIESFGSVGVYDQWITPPVPGQRPKARFEIPWENKLLSIVGHTKDPNESIQGVSETVVVTSVQGRVPVASEGSSLVVSSYDGEDTLLSFRGYNGRYNNEVYVLKSSHISTLQSKLIENSIPNSVYGVHNATNATRNLESETGHKWIKELAVDNVDSIAEKEELKSSLHKDKLQTLQLKQELSEAETRNSDLCKEEVVELSQKLQTIGTLQKELELLQRQKNASEQAALNAKQKQGSGGVWGSSDRVIELTG
ncbi:Acyl-CoA-binding domain-containing protein 4 [Glycine soja]|uniref:Acyl-CoA-binding domain-containing protein 4 n=1 Tax=Glycine soja TaxID=3848 RepID=A0A445IMT9_GLYSO|nr:Acyl-CoA-binding domain-containing protein 4 [Glycine soja]